MGNLTLETGLGSHNTDYLYNNLNQQVDRSSDNWKTHTASTYDKRGDLILEQYGKNKKLTTAGAYTYDETNRMVDGVNGNAEHSIYTYNGLGALMEQTWIIAKNGYGYHDVDADVSAAAASVEVPEVPNPAEDAGIPDAAGPEANSPEETSPEETATEESGTPASETGTLEAALVRSGNNGNGNNGNNGNGNGNKDKPTGSDVKKTSTVVKQFVVDFSREDFKPLMEHEVNGLDYRYVNSDKARLSVVVQGIENGSASLLDAKGELHAYYHTDYLGITDYLTSAVNSKVISWTSYSEWGEITHNAVLKCGQRELDLVKEYATHDFDAVLNMYYAKARFYDADNRHFAAVDPILDPSQYDLRQYVKEPMALVQYLYVRNNAVNLIDLLGLEFYAPNIDVVKSYQLNGIDYVSVADIDKAYAGIKSWSGENNTLKLRVGEYFSLTFNKAAYTTKATSVSPEYIDAHPEYTLPKEWINRVLSINQQYIRHDGGVYVRLDYFNNLICETLGKSQRLKSSLVSMEEYRNLGFKNTSERMQQDLNRVLFKYGIVERDEIRRFMAEVFAEAGYDEDQVEDDTTRSYKPYYGTGFIQVTHDYGYQAFATYRVLEDYPSLRNSGVKYRSPKNFGKGDIAEMYEIAKTTAEAQGIDFSEYKRIFKGTESQGPTEYVAQRYSWEISGYYWAKATKIHSIYPTLREGNARDMDKITDIVNGGLLKQNI